MANETDNSLPLIFLSIYGGCVIVLGTIGNLFIVLVMHHDTSLKKTTRVLFSLLAFGDFVVLWTLVIRYFVYTVFGFDFRSRDGNNMWCKVHIFLAYASSNFAMGSLCILCVDRCIAINEAVKKTISYYSRKSTRYIVIAYVVLILVIFGKHLYIGWKFGMTPEGECDEIIVGDVHYWLDFITNAVIPYLILIPANAMVYVTLQKHSFHMKKIGIEINKSSFSKVQRPIVKMTITISVLHFLLTLPGYIYTQVLNPRNDMYLPNYIHMDLTMGLLMVSFTNSAIPFYAYLCTTERFRRKCKTSLRALCSSRSRNNSKAPQPNSSYYSTHL